MNYLWVDYGSSKSGIAININNVAIPLKIVETHKLIEEIKTEINSRQILKIIVWIANHSDWTISKHSKKIYSFIKVLRNSIPKNIEIIEQDERYTSFEAKNAFENAWDKKTDSKRLDDVAASIILQSYIDRN